ncbi:hypothetical protein [Nocardia macrotermitis]|uniref:YhhN-like protein n=1 Tax=Nocardia macrotermitis TaxID=2585198 RepID=A0A7K0DEZ3_9NOCA|nr:hypothetical protein [Nocardia macrotermitis]MQY24101.1 hypothetical protein [Nocardia macrotermitis]
MNAPVNYPIPLAVEDFAPVLLTAVGVLLLRRTVPDRRTTVTVAAALIGCGGLAKATAKLLAALDLGDHAWLRGALFPLLAVGFGLLCLALPPRPTPTWLRILVPLLIAACAVGGVLKGAPSVFLVGTMIFATVAGVQLISTARARRVALAAVLFAVQLAAFFLLGFLASRDGQTIPLQWVEQLSNTAAQVAFVYAAWRLGSASGPADTA